MLTAVSGRALVLIVASGAIFDRGAESGFRSADAALTWAIACGPGQRDALAGQEIAQLWGAEVPIIVRTLPQLPDARASHAPIVHRAGAEHITTRHAVFNRSAVTDAEQAAIVRRAGVPIVASRPVRQRHTTGPRITLPGETAAGADPRIGLALAAGLAAPLARAGIPIVRTLEALAHAGLVDANIADRAEKAVLTSLGEAGVGREYRRAQKQDENGHSRTRIRAIPRAAGEPYAVVIAHSRADDARTAAQSVRRCATAGSRRSRSSGRWRKSSRSFERSFAPPTVLPTPSSSVAKRISASV